MRWWVACGLVAVLPGRASVAQEQTALVDVRVLMPDGMVRGGQTILVAGDRIVAVGRRDSVAVAAGVRRLDLPAGAVVIPGLVDAHVHLEAAPTTWMSGFLDAGVTTVFNLRGSPEHLALRDSVRRGLLPGPRIFTTGGYANLPAIETAEQADSLVRAQKAAGYDMVKIHGRLAPAAYAAMSRASEREGLPIVGHAPRNLPFDSVLASAQRMVAHAEEILYTHFAADRSEARMDSVTKAMASRGIWLTPNLAMYAGIAAQIGRPAVPDSAIAALGDRLPGPLRSLWASGMYANRPIATAPGYAANLEFLRRLTAVAWRNGVMLLSGTDTPLPVMEPGTSLLRELEELVALGMTPAQALATATDNPGRFAATVLGSADRFGVIRPGAAADLMVVAGDPLESLDALREPLGVMVRGIWRERPR